MSFKAVKFKITYNKESGGSYIYGPLFIRDLNEILDKLYGSDFLGPQETGILVESCSCPFLHMQVTICHSFRRNSSMCTCPYFACVNDIKLSLRQIHPYVQFMFYRMCITVILLKYS